LREGKRSEWRQIFSGELSSELTFASILDEI